MGKSVFLAMGEPRHIKSLNSSPALLVPKFVQYTFPLLCNMCGQCTGRRHFPEELPEGRVASAERPESFGMRSTQDMYRDFPAAVRSSFPLYIRTAGPQVKDADHSSPARHP